MNFCNNAQSLPIMFTIMMPLILSVQLGETFAQSPDGFSKSKLWVDALIRPQGTYNPNLPATLNPLEEAGALHSSPPIPGESMSSSFTNLVQYKHPTLGISFFIPANSIIIEENANGVGIGSSDPYFSVALTTAPAFDLSREQITTDIKNGSPDPDLGSIIDGYETLLSDIPASMLIWYSPQTQLYIAMVITVHNDIGYNLSFMADAVNYPNLLILFGQIRDSFQML